jgi:Tol biopolymer transport system component
MWRRVTVLSLATISCLFLGAQASFAAFPGANGKIAFDRFSAKHHIVVMNPNGTRVHGLIQDGGDPAWAPSGHRIAFERTDQSTGSHTIWIARADGSHQRRFSPTKWDSTSPAWSPDGRQVVFERQRGDTDLVVLNLVTKERTVLLHNDAFEFGPAWSPDGSRIAFASDRFASDLDLYLVDPDGSNLVRLTDTDTYEAQPSWSPDGTHIAFQSDRAEPLENYDVFSMKADGTEVTRLTRNKLTDGAPAWSPDGKRIAFRRLSNIFVMNADGTNIDRLFARQDSINTDPDWQAIPR